MGVCSFIFNNYRDMNLLLLCIDKNPTLQLLVIKKLIPLNYFTGKNIFIEFRYN